MRILFDQGTPVPLRDFLPGHTIETAYERGWDKLSNGDLLTAAGSDGFELRLELRLLAPVTFNLSQLAARLNLCYGLPRGLVAT